jgi:hypothetical protein
LNSPPPWGWRTCDRCGLSEGHKPSCTGKRKYVYHLVRLRKESEIWIDPADIGIYSASVGAIAAEGRCLRCGYPIMPWTQRKYIGPPDVHGKFRMYCVSCFSQLKERG